MHRWVLVSKLMGCGVLAAAAAGCPGDDTGEEGGDGGTSSDSDDGPTTSSASAEDGPEPTSAGSVSATSGDSGGMDSSGGDTAGSGPVANCCVECPEGTVAGDSCSAFSTIPPCCTDTELLTCEDLACGSQSCVGTWAVGACDCSTRTQYYGHLLSLASTCDPAMNGADCVLSETIGDSCGCPMLLNVGADTQALGDVQQDWVDAECGPLPCGAACPTEGVPTCSGDDQLGYWCVLAPPR